jgi:hypothetical protein
MQFFFSFQGRSFLRVFAIKIDSDGSHYLCALKIMSLSKKVSTTSKVADTNINNAGFLINL